MSKIDRQSASSGKPGSDLSAFGRSNLLFAWPIALVALAGCGWLLLSSSAHTAAAKHKYSPQMQAQVDMYWKLVDSQKQIAILNPKAKARAENLEAQLVKATGPRELPEDERLDKSGAFSATRRWFLTANLAIVAFLIFWGCLFYRRSCLVATKSKLEFHPAVDPTRRSVDRQGATLTLLPRTWAKRILGLGARDILVRSQSGEEFVVPNVFRAQTFLRSVEKLPGTC